MKSVLLRSLSLVRSLSPSQTSRASSAFPFSNKVPAPTSSADILYNRIQIIRDPKASIVPVLEKWVEDGRTVTKQELRSLVSLMRDFNRFNHALEISQWMTDRRYFPISPNDVAVRLDLISRVHGIEDAEKYFNNISENFKTVNLYGALLNMYVREKCVAKAEATMERMRGMGFATTSFPFNILINLYSHTGEHEKIDALMQEMENLEIPHDMFTLKNRMSAYALASDIPGMEKILKRLEDDPNFVVDWRLYSLAASGYVKAGLVDKASAMLKKLEEKMPRQKRISSLKHLLSLHASCGSKDEVHRIWNLYKPKNGLPNDGLYSVMIVSLAKLDNIAGAEEIFQEWESRCEIYNFQVLNKLVGAYCKKGLPDKAKLAIEKASSGRTPYPSTWNILAEGYAQEKQMDKAVEAIKRSLLVGRKGWKPNAVVLDACLEYLEGQEDIEGMKEIVAALNNLGGLDNDIYQRLLKAVVASGQSTCAVFDQMNLNVSTAGDATCNGSIADDETCDESDADNETCNSVETSK